MITIKREINCKLQVYEQKDYEEIIRSKDLAELLYNIASCYRLTLNPLHLKHLSLKFSCDQDGFYIIADCPNCNNRHFYRTPCNSFFCKPCKKYLNSRIKRNAKKYLWNCNHFFATFTLPPEIQRLVTSWDKISTIKISKRKIKNTKNDYTISEKKIYYVDLVYKAVNSTIKIYYKKHNILSGFIILPHSYGSENLNWFFHPNVLVSSKGFRINPDKKIETQKIIKITKSGRKTKEKISFLNFRFTFGDDYSNFNNRIIDYRFNYNELRVIYEQQLKKVFRINYIKDTPQVKFSEKKDKRTGKKSIYIPYKRAIKIILDYFRNIPIDMENIINISEGKITYQTYKAEFPNKIPLIDFFNLIMQHIPQHNFRTLRAYDLYSNHHKIQRRYPKSLPKPLKNLQCEKCDSEMDKEDFIARIQAGNIIWINPLKLNSISMFWFGQTSILDLEDSDKDFEHQKIPEITPNGKLLSPKKPPPDMRPLNKLNFPSNDTEEDDFGIKKYKKLHKSYCKSCEKDYHKEDMQEKHLCRICFSNNQVRILNKFYEKTGVKKHKLQW